MRNVDQRYYAVCTAGFGRGRCHMVCNAYHRVGCCGIYFDLYLSMYKKIGLMLFHIAAAIVHQSVHYFGMPLFLA